jgi:predicted cytidylate kinase
MGDDVSAERDGPAVTTKPGPTDSRLGYTSARADEDVNDMENRTVALSGDLGSGKSSVAGLVAEAMGARQVSTGAAQRQIAAQRGISTLELNRQAEVDPSIDEEIDSVFRSLAESIEPLVVDSRLAWHFLPEAVKVHLVVDPEVAAARVLQREATRAERYGSAAEALQRIGDRADSERRRFQQIYGVDIFKLANYDLVVDTSTASPDEVARAVLDHLAARRDLGPVVLLDPQRVQPISDDEGGDGLTSGPVAVVYRRPTFTVVRGRRELAAARRLGLSLAPAVLQAEEDLPASGQ